MKLKIYAIFDQAAAAFLPPVTQPTEAMLVRSLRDLPEQNPKHAFVRHAEQYTVFCLGEFDEITGVISNIRQEAVVNLKVLFSQSELWDSPAEQAKARLRAVGEEGDQ